MSYEINKKTDYELIPIGTELECRIEKMTFKTTTSGRKYIDVSFRVRDDVDSNGQFKNRVLFKAIWSLKDKLDMYNPVDISNLTNTQNYEGNSIVFLTIDDVIVYLTGINLRVKVGIEESEQYGNRNICSKFLKTNFAPKKVEEIEKVEPTNNEQTNDEDLSVISDDNLPF